MSANRAVDAQAGVGPVANPVAVVQVRMTGVTVANVRFVVTAARAQRACPAGVTVVFRIDVAALEEISLFLPIKAGQDMTQGMRIGIDEPMTGRDISGGS